MKTQTQTERQTNGYLLGWCAVLIIFDEDSDEDCGVGGDVAPW